MQKKMSNKHIHYLFVLKLICAFLVGAGSMYFFVFPHLSKNSNVFVNQPGKNDYLSHKDQSNDNVRVNTEIKKSDSWAIYTDSNKIFSFSYPSDWHITSHADRVELTSSHTIDNTALLVNLMIDRSNQPMKEWLQGKIIGGQCCSNNFTLEQFTQNNQLFYTVTQEKSPYIGVIGTKNGSIYYFYPVFGGLEGNNMNEKNNAILMQDLETYKKITSTFTFL